MKAEHSIPQPVWGALLAQRGSDSVGRVVDEILTHAIQAQASDIHWEPMASCLRIRFRLNGLMKTIAELPRAHAEQILARVKVIAGLLTYKTDRPQDGYIPPPKDSPKVELRVSTFPTVHGEKIVVRIFDSQRVLLDIDAIGADPETLNALKSVLLRPQGLVILTGPAGTGKTTTLYSALKFLQKEKGPWASFSTLEDPVECQMDGICQTQISPNSGFGYAEALRTLMRQDPKIILLGEIRDAETARTAVQVGLSGLQVLTTMHSGSAAGIFARLLHMNIEPFLVASAVSGVVAQRLARTLCPHCIEDDLPDPALFHFPGADTLEDVRVGTFRRGRGCDECASTGYLGQTAIMDLLVVNSELREAILNKATTEQLAAAARRGTHGLWGLWRTGYKKAQEGITTMAELHRVLTLES